MGMNITLENIAKTMRASEAKAAVAFAAFDAKRKAMAEAGVNPLGASEDEVHAFEELRALSKDYHTAADEVAQLKAKADELTAIMGLGAPAPGRSFEAGDGQFDFQAPRAPRSLSLGQRFVSSAQYGQMRESGAFTTEAAFRGAMTRGFDRPIDLMSAEQMYGALKAMRFNATTVTGGGSTSMGPFIVNDLQPGFIEYRRKRPLIASLVASSTTESDVVEYVTESAPTDASAETAEDTAAPEAAFTWATNTTNVREITQFIPVTLRAMADAGQARGIVENRLSLGVLDRLDTQLVSGGGTGQDLLGIYNASPQSQALGGDSRADALHKAITKIEVYAGVLASPDYIGMHPNDAQDLRLEQDTDGNYLFGPPSMSGPMQVWGVDIARSTVFTDGTPLVGDFAGSAELWVREGLSVNAGLDGNDFTKRRISLLAAMRVAFAVTRANGFCTVTGF